MFSLILGLLNEIWILFVEMAPYLLLGFLVAGLLNLFLTREQVAKHLSERRFSSIWKASILGIPLPLCSCGVIPVAAHLDKQGANRGATLSFLISTPTTGVDSILATYGLLGPLLTIARPVAALVNGLLTGSLAIFWDKEKEADSITQSQQSPSCAIPKNSSPETSKNLIEKLKSAINYGFVELLEDVSKWLVIGIITGGMISFLIPTSFVENYLGNPLMSYSLMLLIGIPMYVCATGSIPIAAALILKGMSPGAGFVFLFAGPATNTATLSFVGGKLGKKHLILYLTTILLCSVAFGALIDYVWISAGQDLSLISGAMEMLPEWLKIASALLLLALMLRPFVMRFISKPVSDEGLHFEVPDMNCEHCKKTITGALQQVDGVHNVNVMLSLRLVQVVGNAERNELENAIRNAGYNIRDVR